MNAFLKLADRQISAPVKARQRAIEKRTARKAEQKALAERDALFRSWKRWRREQFDAALAGPHGEALKALLAFLETVTLETADGVLVEQVRLSSLQNADSDIRFLALHMISEVTVRLREERGLVPFDDVLPGEPPTAFQIIREMLR
jgi:hypothetical protein